MNLDDSFIRLFTTTPSVRAEVAAGLFKHFQSNAASPEKAAVALIDQFVARLMHGDKLELVIERVKAMRLMGVTLPRAEQPLGAAHPPLESITTPDGVRAMSVNELLPGTAAQAVA